MQRKRGRFEIRENPIIRDDDGFPVIRGQSQGGDAASTKDNAGSKQSHTSWRSFASTRQSKESMSDGHIVPSFHEAVDKGGLMFFRGSKGTERSSSAVPLEPQPKEEVDDEEFIKQLAQQIEERTSRDMERRWYENEDEQSRSLFDGTDEERKHKARIDRYKRDHEKLRNTFSAEQEMWEANRLAGVGIHVDSNYNASFASDYDEGKTVIHVKAVDPEFLRSSDKPTAALSQRDISVVVDTNSDLARAAKAGSNALRRLKEEADKSRMRDKFWQLAGSTMGKVVGVKDTATEDDLKAIEEIERFEPVSNLGRSLLASSNVHSPAEIAAARAVLPVTACKYELLTVIRENPVTIVVGETGSGKTTQLTQYMLEAGFGGQVHQHTIVPGFSTEEEVQIVAAPPWRGRYRFSLIGCTQPRRVAAVSVAKRVADEYGCTLGRDVGYSIRFEDCTSEFTKIKYMTDAFLLREILSDPDLEKYDAIIMDEAHERSLATDVLFGLLKGLVGRRNDFRLVVTSATMNAQAFSSFFGQAPIFTIPGRTFPVRIEYARSVAEDYVESAVHQCMKIHANHPFDASHPSDILVFMTGQEDIEAVCFLLSQRAEELSDKLEPLAILPIYSTLPADVQARVFQRTPYRKIIVATNIAETSLTLEGIKFVVDSGFCKLKVYSPQIGMDSLQLTPISRANANQRAGRAGRTAPGMCYRLYTENAYFSEMFETQLPEIQRTNLAHVVLLLKSLKIADVLNFEFLDPPSVETVVQAQLQLWMLGALADDGAQ